MLLASGRLAYYFTPAVNSAHHQQGGCVLAALTELLAAEDKLAEAHCCHSFPIANVHNSLLGRLRAGGADGAACCRGQAGRGARGARRDGAAAVCHGGERQGVQEVSAAWNLPALFSSLLTVWPALSQLCSCARGAGASLTLAGYALGSDAPHRPRSLFTRRLQNELELQRHSLQLLQVRAGSTQPCFDILHACACLAAVVTIPCTAASQLVMRSALPHVQQERIAGSESSQLAEALSATEAEAEATRGAKEAAVAKRKEMGDTAKVGLPAFCLAVVLGPREAAGCGISAPTCRALVTMHQGTFVKSSSTCPVVFLPGP